MVGLVAPPLLASVVVGGAVGGLVGKFAKKKEDSGLEAGLGEKLPPGAAAIIAVVDGDDRLAAERALAGTPARSVVSMEKGGMRDLKGALVEAAGKFTPRPHGAAHPRPCFRRDDRPARCGTRCPTGR